MFIPAFLFFGLSPLIGLVSVVCCVLAYKAGKIGWSVFWGVIGALSFASFAWSAVHWFMYSFVTILVIGAAAWTVWAFIKSKWRKKSGEQDSVEKKSAQKRSLFSKKTAKAEQQQLPPSSAVDLEIDQLLAETQATLERANKL